MVRDIFKNKQGYMNWIEEVLDTGIPNITKANSDIILEHIKDMEEGRNIARGSKKGGRSYARLNTLRARLPFIAKLIKKQFNKDMIKITEKEISKMFNDMERGIIVKEDGEPYKSYQDYIKVFKAFWHWYMKVSRKKGKLIDDITLDLNTNREENTFVYVTKEELESMLPYFSEEQQTVLLFCFDTIIIAPTELLNVRVSDLTPDCSELTIRGETSKTYGRTIKILLCRDAIVKHIKDNKLKHNDYLFQFNPYFLNRKLQKVTKEVFGEKITKGGKKYSEMTLYALRHSGAIHWRKGAYNQKIDALMYRGGWSNLDILNYYTKKIGMRDSIEKTDLLIGVDKNEMEKKIEDLMRFKNDVLKMLNPKQQEEIIFKIE